MINDFADFCLWLYITVDDIWQTIAPLVCRPGPELLCNDSELMSMALIGELDINPIVHLNSQLASFFCLTLKGLSQGGC